MSILKDLKFVKKKTPEGRSMCEKTVGVSQCIPALAWGLVWPSVMYDPGSPASNS